LVTHGDGRAFTIWEVIKNTIDARPGQFFVIIDEAHRGMTEENGLAAAATIIQKFIKGSQGCRVKRGQTSGACSAGS
jgi:type III restriction enzyme